MQFRQYNDLNLLTITISFPITNRSETYPTVVIDTNDHHTPSQAPWIKEVGKC